MPGRADVVAQRIGEAPVDNLDPGRGSTNEGRLWAYRDVAGGTCYFDWHPGRNADCQLGFLGYDNATNTVAWQGTIHTDGYIFYDTVATKHGLRHAAAPPVCRELIQRTRSRPIADELHRIIL